MLQAHTHKYDAGSPAIPRYNKQMQADAGSQNSPIGGRAAGRSRIRAAFGVRCPGLGPRAAQENLSAMDRRAEFSIVSNRFSD
jgi:hypothetical protein